jgi:hypothetical protein
MPGRVQGEKIIPKKEGVKPTFFINQTIFVHAGILVHESGKSRFDPFFFNYRRPPRIEPRTPRRMERPSWLPTDRAALLAMASIRVSRGRPAGRRGAGG